MIERIFRMRVMELESDLQYINKINDPGIRKKRQELIPVIEQTLELNRVLLKMSIAYRKQYTLDK